VLVLPPDPEARIAIWTMHLRDRPVAGIDVKKLATAADGYTGAAIAHLCESAAEIALLEAAETGNPRMIGQADIEAALSEVRPWCVERQVNMSRAAPAKGSQRNNP
jgi:SpoVK/Ycf46/Vps4 family AAA+-type ATPase